MSNVAGQAYSLTVLTPLLPDREPALRATLEQLHEGKPSLFEQLGDTHVVRLVLIDQLVFEGPPQLRDSLTSRYLLFTAVFDGALEPFLYRLCRRMGSVVDSVWSHCVGFPGTRDPGKAIDYFRHNLIDATFFYAAYPDASMTQVLDALALRERFTSFALQAQDMEPTARQAAFQATFPSPSRPR